MKRTMSCWMDVVSVAALILGCAQVLAMAEPVDTFMGDWQGVRKGPGGKADVVAQVIALGNGKYRARILDQFDTRDEPRAVLHGSLSEKTVVFGENALITDGKFTGTLGEGLDRFKMRRVERKSPTLGAKPPKGAVVLFDGKHLDAWQHPNGKPCGWKLQDGVMEVVPKTGSVISRKAFMDHALHIEFRTPFMPKDGGQGRGNSGVYLQGRYEVQVLDSYGLEGRDNECGGIYKVGAPRVNMCFPPMQWQTYDVTFKAPRFGTDGRKTANALITVLHNGVEIHKDLEIPGPTQANHGGDVRQPGGLYLQDHGNAVQYRNIWAVSGCPGG